MTTAAKQPSTMRQLGALLGLLWSGRPRFGRRNLVSVVGASDTGVVRGNNEDYFLVADLNRPAMTTHGNDTLGNLISEQPVLIVADGMGGAAGGEIASGLAATVIWSHLAQAARDRGLLRRGGHVQRSFCLRWISTISARTPGGASWRHGSSDGSSAHRRRSSSRTCSRWSVAKYAKAR